MCAQAKSTRSKITKKPTAPSAKNQHVNEPVRAEQHAYVLVLSRYERGKRRFVRLPDATVLAWFRRNWRRSAEQRSGELQGAIYGLETVFDDLSGEAPISDAELISEIDRKLYSEGGHDVQQHFIAVQTDDDENPISYYFFDDQFLAKPGSWDELPDWRSGTALAAIDDPGDRDEDDEEDEEEQAEDDQEDDRDGEEHADAFERFYRERNRP